MSDCLQTSQRMPAGQGGETSQVALPGTGVGAPGLRVAAGDGLRLRRGRGGEGATFIQGTKNAECAGVPLTVASRVLGHADSAMTRRYQRHGAAMTDEHASAIEAALGMTG